MKHFFAILFLILYLLTFPAAKAGADIVILKNGQVIEDVTVKDEGEVYYLESSKQSFYINKSAVETIVGTGPRTFPERAKEFFKTLPDKSKNFYRDYFNFIAVSICLLILLVALLIFKFLWVNIRAISTKKADRKSIIQAVKTLDDEEKSVLREFEIQRANTIEMPVEDSIVAGLMHKGVLEATSEKGQYAAGGLFLPLAISAVAKKRIKPKNIGMPDDINDEKERDRLAKTRPRFMYEMAEFYRSLKRNRTRFHD
jgi:hypothetical protein